MNNRGKSTGEWHVDALTWREQEILTLLAKRLTNREIANCLHLAESTVKDYVGQILSKLYVKNRREAVERAKALGLLNSDREAVSSPPIFLPSDPTQFVGRVNELTEIKRCLRDTGLLTLTGPGGIGKTRLALKAAREIAANFEDGTFFVSLAPIHSADQIVQTIAEAVKFPLATQETPQNQLIRYLSQKQMLLVIDNFDHLLDGIGILSEILQAAPAVKILVTSRERLNLQRETILSVGGLSFPDHTGSKDIPNSDAIILFKQSANRVRPGFDPSPDELEQIVKICQIVQGMPLAIELAAAWLSILNVDEVAIEIEKGLDILETDMRDTPERHRSIRAVFEHSWSLLDQSEQKIFMTLSVFRGGFTRHAAQQITGATLQQLAGLVNKSLLSLDPDSGRLEVHELLRQFAQERLGEALDVNISARADHAAYYAAFMQQKGQELKYEKQILALAEIEADIQNVRAAWQYSLDLKIYSQIWMFIFGLWYVYWIRWWNHAGVELFAEAVKALQDEEEASVTLRALAMAYQSYFMGWLGLANQGYALAEESLAILNGLNYPEGLVFAYISLGVNAYFIYRYSDEIQAMEKMLAIATRLEDKWLLAFSLFAKSMATIIQDDYQEARRLAKWNLDLSEELGDLIGSTPPLIVLGHAAFALGEMEDARGYYLRCLKISQETGFHFAIQSATKYLCKVALSMGNIAEAEKYLLQSLSITREIGFIRDIVNLLYEFARLQVAQGNLEGAVELLVLVIQHPASDLYRMLDGRIRDSAKDLLAQLEDDLSLEKFNKSLARGRELELDTIVSDLLGPKQRL